MNPIRCLLLSFILLSLSAPAFAYEWSTWSEWRALKQILYRYRTTETQIAGETVEKWQFEFQNVTDDKLGFTWVLESNGQPNSTGYSKIIGPRKTISDSTSAWRRGQANNIILRNIRVAESYEW